MRRSRTKTTKWNLFFHYYAVAFSIVWGLLLVPLYLKYIPLEIYGGWLATGNIAAWITIFDPGIAEVLRQQVGKAYGAGATEELNDLLGSGTILSLIVSISILIIGLVLASFLVNLISIQDQNTITVLKNAFILAMIGASIVIFSYGFTSFSQGLLGSIGIGLVYVVSTLTSLVVNIVLLIKGYGLYSIPISQIVSALLLLTGNIVYIIWRYFQESLKFRFSIKGIYDLAKLSGYNILGRIGTILSTQIDSFLVARYLGAEITPVFNLTKKGPELSRMFVERPPIAMLPAITNAWGNGEFDTVRKNTSRLLTMMLWMFGLLFTGFIIFNKSFVTLWVGQKFYAGDSINMLICLGVLLSVLVRITSSIFFSLGNIKETSTISFLQSVLTVASLYIGIKYFGVFGLVLAQVLSLLAYSAWYFPYQTFKFIKYDLSFLKQVQKETAIIVIISAALIIISFKTIFIQSWGAFMVYVVIVTFTYLIALFFLSKSFKTEMLTILKLTK